jgi:hypothetical protein
MSDFLLWNIFHQSPFSGTAGYTFTAVNTVEIFDLLNVGDSDVHWANLITEMTVYTHFHIAQN